MAYDPEKDVELKHWRLATGLQVSVNQYNGGEPKLRIGPRFIEKKDGTESMAKAGGLTQPEVMEFVHLAGDILDVMKAASKGK
jgi:hypothetical protein